jgi:hypothetical protein
MFFRMKSILLNFDTTQSLCQRLDVSADHVKKSKARQHVGTFRERSRKRECIEFNVVTGAFCSFRPDEQSI